MHLTTQQSQNFIEIKHLLKLDAYPLSYPSLMAGWWIFMYPDIILGVQKLKFYHLNTPLLTQNMEFIYAHLSIWYTENKWI